MSELPPEQRTNAQIDVATIDTATIGTLLLFLDDDIDVGDAIANKAYTVKVEKVAYHDRITNKAKVVIIEGLSYSEVLRRGLFKVVNIVDAIAFSDSSTKGATLFKANKVAFSDSSFKSAMAIFTADSIGYLDKSYLHPLIMLRDGFEFKDTATYHPLVSLAERLAVADVAKRSVFMFLNSESIGYLDKVIRQPSLKLPAQFISYTPSNINGVISYLNEKVAFTDSRISSAFIELTQESLLYTDRIIRQPIVRVSEQLIYYDSIFKQVQSFINEKVSIRDFYGSRTVQIHFLEGFGYIDSVSKKPIIMLQDGVQFAEPALRRSAQLIKREFLAFKESSIAKLIRKIKSIITGLKGVVSRNTTLTGLIERSSDIGGKIVRSTGLTGGIKRISNIRGTVTANTILTAHVRVEHTRYPIYTEETQTEEGA